MARKKVVHILVGNATGAVLCGDKKEKHLVIDQQGVAAAEPGTLCKFCLKKATAAAKAAEAPTPTPPAAA